MVTSLFDALRGLQDAELETGDPQSKSTDEKVTKNLDQNPIFVMVPLDVSSFLGNPFPKRIH